MPKDVLVDVVLSLPVGVVRELGGRGYGSKLESHYQGSPDWYQGSPDWTSIGLRSFAAGLQSADLACQIQSAARVAVDGLPSAHAFQVGDWVEWVGGLSGTIRKRKVIEVNGPSVVVRGATGQPWGKRVSVLSACDPPDMPPGTWVQHVHQPWDQPIRVVRQGAAREDLVPRLWLDSSGSSGPWGHVRLHDADGPIYCKSWLKVVDPPAAVPTRQGLVDV